MYLVFNVFDLESVRRVRGNTPGTLTVELFSLEGGPFREERERERKSTWYSRSPSMDALVCGSINVFKIMSQVSVHKTLFVA